MDVLRTVVRTYSALREVPCVVCGHVREQQYVGVALFRGEDMLGEVCLPCLAVGPAGAAQRAMAFAAQLATRAEQAEGDARQPRPARDQRGRRPGSTVRGRKTLKKIGRLRAHAEELTTLAIQLAATERWGVSLGQVRAAERLALAEHFPALCGDDLNRLLEERYRGLSPESP
jgi:hypothetical protein